MFNFSNIGKDLGLAAGLLPVVASAVQIVEQPGLTGAQKADAAGQIALQTVQTIAPGASFHGIDIAAAIKAAITTVVTVFNAIGVFTHKETPPAS